MNFGDLVQLITVWLPHFYLSGAQSHRNQEKLPWSLSGCCEPLRPPYGWGGVAGGSQLSLLPGVDPSPAWRDRGPALGLSWDNPKEYQVPELPWGGGGFGCSSKASQFLPCSPPPLPSNHWC